MQRREFSRALAGAGALAAAGWSGMAWAQIGGFKDGSDYRRLARPVPVDAAAGQIEVLEFFSYSCVHCYRFEPVMNADGSIRALRFVFPPYQVAPYVEGTRTVDVPARVLVPLVAPAFKPLFRAG